MLNLLVVPIMTEDLIPSSKFNIDPSDFCKVKLSDAKFNVTERVEMLSGVQVFYAFVITGRNSYRKFEPHFAKYGI